jgi:cytochrome d ubiquinol oxidase subunit II
MSPADIWFAILALVLVAYSVLDGFDFGAGLLHLFVAKTDAERRSVLSAIGPFWDGNEVWLIAAGGVLFLAFPAVLATAFPAFYLALFLVLWSLVLRGISIEARSQFEDPLWVAFWDVVFGGSSGLLALLFGVALGNVVRGVPLDAKREFTMSLFTDFRATQVVGLLDYYTLSVGALSVAVLASHGAAFLAWRTTSEVRRRARAVERALWLVAATLFALVTLETAFVRPELLQNMLRRPLAWLSAVIAVAGLGTLMRARRNERPGLAFLGSCAAIAGVLAAAAAGSFPTLLHSTLNGTYDLSVPEAASTPASLRAGLRWWPFAFVLVVAYFTIVYRLHRRAVEPDDEYGSH